MDDATSREQAVDFPHELDRLLHVLEDMVHHDDIEAFGASKRGQLSAVHRDSVLAANYFAYRGRKIAAQYFEALLLGRFQ
jgi:hypothetical protein